MSYADHPHLRSFPTRRSSDLTPLPNFDRIIGPIWSFARLGRGVRSEEHTSELQSRGHLVCRLLLEKKIIYSENQRALTVIDAMRNIHKQVEANNLYDTAATENYTLSLHDALPI